MFANGTPAKYTHINSLLLFNRIRLLILAFSQFCAAGAQDSIRLSPPQTSSTRIFFTISTCIRFDFRQPGAVIRYTLNGDEPDENSAMYSNPVCIPGSAVIKAKSFAEGFTSSETITVKCIKLADVIKSVRGTGPDEPYNKEGLDAIHDKLPGGQNTRERWLGFRADTVAWEIRFLKKQLINKIHISLMQAQESWIFYPLKMELISFKGKILGLGYFNGGAGPANDEARIFSFPLGRKLKGFIIRIQNYSSIPDWHQGRGNKPWLFVDEIAVE